MSIDLRPTGGRWSGLLFDNPHIHLPERLTWTFAFDFEDVIDGTDGTDVSSVGATIEWVPLPGVHWRALTGSSATSAMFGTPIEASVTWTSHHRFDQTRVRIAEQRGTDLHVIATLAGDIDGWGVDAIHVDDWLRFDGIRVALSNRPTTGAAARAALAAHIDIDGLEPTAVGSTWHFLPADPPPGDHRAT